MVPYHMRWCPLSQTAFPTYSVDQEKAFRDQKWVGPFSALNVFIGPTNSGKSRLLRDIASCGSVLPYQVRANARTARVREILTQSKADLAEVFPTGGWGLSMAELDPEFLSMLQAIGNGSESAMCFALRLDCEVLHHKLKEFTDRFHAKTFQNHGPNAVSRVRTVLERLMETIKADSPGIAEPTRLYIPVLRGLRPLDQTGANRPADMFGNRTNRDYFEKLPQGPMGIPSAVKAPQLWTGLGVYADVAEHNNGDPVQQDILRDYESFLSRRFFRGESVKLTSRVFTDNTGQNNVLWVQIGGEEQRPVYSLGDGLGQIVIQTMPIFMHRETNLMLFIEEPETHLHPGLQRELIEAFISEPCVGHGARQVFVTTHSNAFMDLTLDPHAVAVFRCTKSSGERSGRYQAPRVSIQPRAGRSLEVLRELGVSNSSVLLSNCTIWVEGITDRMYFRRFLTLLGKEIPSLAREVQEDVHYSFVEYSGANITHWSFLDEEQGIDEARLCGVLFIIVDDDGTAVGEAPAKEARHAKLGAKLGDRFCRLPCREVENLLAPSVVAKIIHDYEAEKLTQLREVAWEDYAHAKLGEFIEKEWLPVDYVSKRPTKTGHPYADESGTVKDKPAFADRAMNHLQSWGDLSPAAKKVTKAICRFIRSQNGLPSLPQLAPES